MDKYITHKAYTWANEFNKYIKNVLKGKTKEERDEQIKKLLDEKDKKIEELKTVIDKSDKSICEDIEREPNPKRCFLIIGEDEDLIECIVTYIFCFYLNKTKLFFNSEDFTGNDDETIKEKLIYQGDSSTWIRQGIYLTNPSYLKLIDLMDEIEASRRDLLLYFQYGGTLFLRNLKSQDHEMLKCIAMKIREIVTKNADSHGTLIVSTDNKDNLSDYFTNQFEIIPLGQDKQSGTEDIPQLKPEFERQGETTDILQVKPEKDSPPFPTPSGTQWHEVKISFIDNENIKISVRDKTENKHYSQMGFKDGKSNKPILLWKFLKELASLSGRFTNCPDKEKDKVKKNFSDLRRALRQLFKIKSDPIPYINTKDCKGYKTAFIIENKSYDEYEHSTREHLKEYVSPKNKRIYKDEDENDKFTDNYSLND